MYRNISIILPSFRRPELLDLALKSIFNSDIHRNYHLRVCVVWNGEDQSSREIISRYQSLSRKNLNLDLIVGNKNWLWSRSVCEGLEYSKHLLEKPDSIVLMNDDVYFGKKVLNSFLTSHFGEFNNRMITTCLIEDLDRENISTGLFSINPRKFRINKINNNTKFTLLYGDCAGARFTMYPYSSLKELNLKFYKLIPHYFGDLFISATRKKLKFNILCINNIKMKSSEKFSGQAQNETMLRKYWGKKGNHRVQSHIWFWILYFYAQSETKPT
jgi:GT2 family glycosyltransferase